MKKLFYLLAIMLIVLTFNSCVTDSDNLETQKTKLFENSKINDFLNDYYDIDYSINEVITSEVNDIKITSLSSVNQNSPIGYVITGLKSNKFLSFINIDFELNQSITFDFVDDKIFVNDDFFISNNIKNYNDFNLISEVQDNILQKKFWGTECHAGSCSTCIECCYYVFWINTGCTDVDFSTGQVVKK